MKRFGLSVAALLCATAVSAQDWTVTMNVSGDVTGTLEAAGTRTGLVGDRAGNFMSADAFTDGIDAGQTTCETAEFFEIDYFFGNETTLGGHVLFLMERRGGQYVAVDPSMFMDTLDNDMEVTQTYATFGDLAVSLENVNCNADGTLAVSIVYKGRLLSEMGGGPAAVAVTGDISADFTLRDMSEY